MVTYPDLSDLGSNPTIGSFMSLPNASYPYYWAWILGSIWMMITLTLYFKEKERKGIGLFLSSMAVSSLAIIFLAVTGTIVGFITLEVMIYILVIGLLIIGIWFFSSDR